MYWTRRIQICKSLCDINIAALEYRGLDKGCLRYRGIIRAVLESGWTGGSRTQRFVYKKRPKILCPFVIFCWTPAHWGKGG